MTDLPINDKGFRIQKLTRDAPYELEPHAAAIAGLAGEIWREHYTPIIGAEQVEYMLAKYQSAERIYADIKEDGYTYFTAAPAGGGGLIGYCGVAPRDDCLFISKIYVHRDYRGRGIARSFFDEAAALCRREYGYTKFRLTVNKNNSGAIALYERVGFVTVDSVKTDIGGGFYMDDYVMELITANMK